MKNGGEWSEKQCLSFEIAQILPDKIVKKNESGTRIASLYLKSYIFIAGKTGHYKCQ